MARNAVTFPMRCAPGAFVIPSLVLLFAAACPCSTLAAADSIAIESLQSIVRNGSEAARNDVISELAEMGAAARPAVPVLLSVLRDRSLGGRGNAADALAKIAPHEPAVVSALIEALGDPIDYERESAAYALGEIWPVPASSLPALTRLLSDKRSSVVAAAAETLGKMGPAAAPAVANLVDALKSKDDFARFQAARVLAVIGPDAGPAVPVAIEMLKSGDKSSRVEASMLLADLGTVAKDAIKPLARSTEDPAFEVQVDAAFALGRTGYEDSASLTAFARAPDEKTRSIRIAYALGSAGAGERAGREAILKLMASADDDCAELRTLIEKELRFQCVANHSAMVAGMESADAHVRHAAAFTLARIGRLASVRNGPDAGALTRSALARLKDSDEGVRTGAALALSSLRPTKAFAEMSDALKEPSENTRCIAAHALGRVRGERAEMDAAVAALIGVLRDERVSVRMAAIRGLGELGPAAASAAPTLIELLKDRSHPEVHPLVPRHPLAPAEQEVMSQIMDLARRAEVREEAARALGEIGPGARTAVPMLIELLKGDPSPARDRAIAALGQVGPDAVAAIPAIEPFLRDSGAKFHAAEALARMGEPGAAALVAALKDSDLRAVAAQELGRCGVDAARPLADALSNEDAHIRISAAKALAKIGPRASAAIPALRLAAESENEDVRTSARAALQAVAADAQRQ